MHMRQTKAIMLNRFANKNDIMVEEEKIEYVNEYIYLGVPHEMERGLEDEINRGITSG